MTITKKSETYNVEHEGRSIRVFVYYPSSVTDIDEDVKVTLPSGAVVTDKINLLRLNRVVREDKIEAIVMEALA